MKIGRFVIVLFISVLFSVCKSSNKKLISIEGKAQGTTWHITYLGDEAINYKPGIESILKELDSSLSTYLPVSLISRINRKDSTVIVDNYFIDVFVKAHEVSKKTEGLFDVTVGPLVNAWGRGFVNRDKIDSTLIDSLRKFVGFQWVHLIDRKITKDKPQVVLDFNAIAQGYSVDVLANYLESNKITNYLVELGGEVKAKGKKDSLNWKVGIDQPIENIAEARALEAIVELNNRALCTSGNYRKFYEINGIKYGHILDPHTGYPAKQNILSASVFADDAMTADAYATAFMVMGLDKSKQFLTDHTDLNIEVYFIYNEINSLKTYASESIKNKILNVH